MRNKEHASFDGLLFWKSERAHRSADLFQTADHPEQYPADSQRQQERRVSETVYSKNRKPRIVREGAALRPQRGALPSFLTKQEKFL